MPKTKIIATLGPASDRKGVLYKMVSHGLDVVRLNFSHGLHKEQLARIDEVRRINFKYRRHIRIMQDLEGYRIRLGLTKDKQGIYFNKKDFVWLTQEKIVADKNILSFDYSGSLKVIKKGQLIYIDDGYIVLEVVGVYKNKLKTVVVSGGFIKSRKGVNIPGANLEFDPLTDKDRFDLRFGLKHKVDFIAQSFVRTKEDILRLKEILPKRNPPKVFAKIESVEGVKNISDIIKVSDGILVAKRDMGICFPLYMVGVLQKKIIKECIKYKKPVITATQMLESMVNNRLATRAEVTDVTNAILDGTDYVMLSAETAVGKYPDLAVKMMNDIIKFTESSAFFKGK